jgi:hypothetical protein
MAMAGFKPGWTNRQPCKTMKRDGMLRPARHDPIWPLGVHRDVDHEALCRANNSWPITSRASIGFPQTKSPPERPAGLMTPMTNAAGITE